MLKSMTFRSTLAAVACAISLSAHAIADTPKQIDVPAGDLVAALESLAKQAAVDLVYQPEQLKSFRTKGVRGTYEPKDAIRILLQGTPLELRTDPTGAMVVTPLKAGSATSQNELYPDVGKPDDSRSRLQLAQTADATTPQSSAVDAPPPSARQGRTDSPSNIEEIVVTAQKREERLQDVPVPVTAISADNLVSDNHLRLQDYYTSVPGFTVAPASKQGSQILSIRGVTTGSGSPSVGILIDDVPYGSSTFLGGGQSIPDIDPGDLARIEVLRGPQGTLYGASSLGGLVKFVTIDPSTDAFSGRLQAGTSSVFNGDGPGYNVRGSVNVPLGDAWAVRASAFTHLDPGYIDNPVRNIEGINRQRSSGGRLAALWRLSDAVSLKVSAIYQDTKLDGAAIADLQPGFGDLQQGYALETGTNTKSQAYSAILTARLGIADLTSLSGYNINSFTDRYDQTWGLGPFTQLLFGVPGTAVASTSRTGKLTQELRLAVPIGQKLDWLVGVFYTKEDTHFDVDILAVDPASQRQVGAYVFTTFPSSYREYAGFTDLTYHFTDRFDIQVGGRESHITQTASDFENGFVWNVVLNKRPDPYSFRPPDSSANAFTYLVTPRFRVSPDLMVYARLASGYRAGGINISAGVPSSYKPDKTQNYELGVKGDLLDHKLSFDTSVYYIRWNDIQLTLRDPVNGSAYNDNGGRAKSQGVELAAQFRPLPGLTIGGWVDWNQAVLTQDLPPQSPTIGFDGDRLPFNTRFSGNLSVEQRFALTGTLSGFVGTEVSYVGNRLSSFQPSTADRPVLPAYAKTDLSTGLRYESWTATLFLNNVADRRGILARGLDVGPPYAVYYIQPRTVGLSLVKTF